MTEIAPWFEKRITGDWFVGDLDVTVDRDEILVTGILPAPDLEESASEDDIALAAALNINEFRESSREERMAIAEEAQALFQRKVSWGAGSEGSAGSEGGDDRRVLFTHLGDL